MSQEDKNAPAPAQPSSGGSGALWLLLICAIAALFSALALCASVFAQDHPIWLVSVAFLAVFPLLPLLWHGLADPGGRDGVAKLTPRSRFALRCLAVALVVFGVSLGDLGPHKIGQNLGALFGHFRTTPVQPEGVTIPVEVSKTHGLESFIPADATLVVGLAGPTAMEQLLAAHGVDTREKLAALDTCKIDLSVSRILIASRGSGTRMIVVRAPGIGDERNLYCLVGVLGPERMQVRSEGDVKLLQVSGLLPKPLGFRLLDQNTLISSDPAWDDTAAQKLFSADLSSATGRLASPFLRVDRTTPLWVVSVDETPKGSWDLAIDARQDDNMFKLQGSSTPPSGEADRAEISLRVPLAFAEALPRSALALGIRGVVAAVLATGSSLPIPPAAAAMAIDAGVI